MRKLMNTIFFSIGILASSLLSIVRQHLFMQKKDIIMVKCELSALLLIRCDLLLAV